MSTALHIAVLMGGDSPEREISLKTGEAVCAALREADHEVREIVLGDPLQAIMTAEVAEADVVFPALHGGAGEDGRIQALLELAGKAYVGSRPGPSAVAMDKPWTKHIARGLGIPTADWAEIGRADDDAAVGLQAASLGSPVVLKPANEGSTLGVHVCGDETALNAALSAIAPRHGRWMLERYVGGHELTVPMLWGESFPVIEIRPHDGFYDYTNKYTPGRTEYLCPAPLNSALSEDLAGWSVRLYRALHLRDMARVDFRYDERHGVSLLEVNSIPGMTATSLLPMGAAAKGIDFVTMCDRLCRIAHERAQEGS